MDAALSFRIARSALVSVIVAGSLLVGGCDIFGSSDDAPAWVGNWEGVDAEPDSVEYPPEDTRILFSLTRDSIKTFLKFSGEECEVETTEIVEIDGNVVTTEGADEDGDDTRLEVSGNTLTITPLGSEVIFEEITARSVDDDPADILDCPSFSSNGMAGRRTVERRLWWRK